MGYDSPIGIYVDGIYMARSAASSFEVADIERVEVLRGPQGTLFGRNTTGGAINFVTRLPDREASLSLRVGGGNLGQINARAILNSGTIGGALRTSLGVLYRKRNGMPQSTLALFLPAANAGFLAGQAVPTTTQGLFETVNYRRQKQFSQEIELISDSGGSFEWVLGGFFFKESGYERNPQNFLFVLDTNQAVFNATNFGALAPLLQAGNPARFRGVPQSSTLGYRSWSESFALYGQGTYRFGGADGALGLTVGLRYSWDKKRMEVFQNGAAPFTDPAQIALNDQKKSFSAPTGHVTLDYRASPEVNLYARVARGYRSGGFNARQPTSVANNIGLIPFKEETITSYELGFKTEFFHRVRINGSAFYNEYKNQLVSLPIPITGGGSFGNAVVNAGKTNYWGFELEGRFAVTNHLTLDGSFGYVKTSPQDFPQVSTTGANANAAALFTPGYAPEYTANAGVSYVRELGGSTRLTARVGYNYTSSFWMFGNPITSPFSLPTKGEARGLVDGQLRLDGLGGEGLGLTLWVKNLTNKAYVMRSVDFGQLGYATTIYGDPRTFGVTLDAKF